MTEHEWNTCADPQRMLRSLVRRKRQKVPDGPGLNPERFRVFALACARRVWDHLTKIMQGVLLHLERDPEDQEPNTREQVWQIGESEAQTLLSRYSGELADIIGGSADYRGLVEIDICLSACAAVKYVAMIKPYHAAVHVPQSAARAVGRAEILAGYPPGQSVPRSAADDRGWESAAERRAQAEVLRDVFGNPFRSVTFDPSWRTDTAVSLARQMREAREFSAMPILADALQDAGCENDDILTHCRGNGPHVRGCWVVDLVLGKW